MSSPWCSGDAAYVTCRQQCQGAVACQKCMCTDVIGRWNDGFDALFSILPLLVVVVVTIKRNPWPAKHSLPLAAVIMMMVRLIYLGSDPLSTCASVIAGAHNALTPLSIIAGAIFLFESMKETGCLSWIMQAMKAVTHGHPIAEVMLIGFSFAYVVEGASGFGTPAALAAPMLSSLGHSRLKSVVVLLLFNTTATVFGAVGTPVWFGFRGNGLSASQFTEIGFKASICIGITALVFVPLCLNVILPRDVIKRNLAFVLMSILANVVPAVLCSFISHEFPTLLGGVVGCIITAVLSQYRIGLRASRSNNDGVELSNVVPAPIQPNPDRQSAEASSEVDHTGGDRLRPRTVAWDENDDDPPGGENPSQSRPSEHVSQMESDGLKLDLKTTVMRTMPLWATFLLLVLTRVDDLGIKRLLTATNPALSINLGTYGVFRLSSSLVFQLNNILTIESADWSYAMLFVPSILPFVLVSLLSFLLLRQNLPQGAKNVATRIPARLKGPAQALLGALILAELMTDGGDDSPAEIAGRNIANAVGKAWVFLSFFVGTLGSFYSGSTTVSNLSFSGVQAAAAKAIGVSKTSVLALQVAGASGGNAVCLHNVVAALAVIGLDNVPEAHVLKKTILYVVLFGVLVTSLMLIFFIRL